MCTVGCGKGGQGGKGGGGVRTHVEGREHPFAMGTAKQSARVSAANGTCGCPCAVKSTELESSRCLKVQGGFVQHP
jgi:hypothetical protein